jgi:thiamine-phosphate pyrophosphorylase
MTGETSLSEACYAILVRCLTNIASECPDLPSSSPPLHRLRNLVLVLSATPETAISGPPPKLTLASALAMTASAQEVLAALREAGGCSRVSGEMHAALTETLAALLDRMGETLRQKRSDRVRGLYVIIDPQVTNGRDPMEIATSAVRGGARMLQLRDKLRDKGEILPLASALQQLCQAHDADLIINDHVDLAAAVGSAGIHVGQTDLPVAQARQVLSPFQVLGRSNHEIDELVQSQEMGVDHLAFGAIYHTGTKGVGRPPQGVDRLREARKATSLPLVAIGGINAGNVAPVVEAGADCICVTAAVGSAPDPEAAAAQLVEAIRAAGGRV